MLDSADELRRLAPVARAEVRSATALGRRHRIRGELHLTLNVNPKDRYARADRIARLVPSAPAGAIASREAAAGAHWFTVGRISRLTVPRLWFTPRGR